MIASLFHALTNYGSVSVLKSMSLDTYFLHPRRDTTTLVTPQRFRLPLIADGVGIPRHTRGLDIVAVAYYLGEGDEGGKTKRNKNRAK